MAPALSLHVGSVAHAGSFVVMAVMNGVFVVMDSMTYVFSILESALRLPWVRRLCGCIFLPLTVINFQDGRERQKSSMFCIMIIIGRRRGSFIPPQRSCLLRNIRAVY